MMFIKPSKPDSKDLLALDQKQAMIDSANSFSDRASTAQRLWRAKNTSLYSRLRGNLTKAQTPSTFCHYCEHSEESAIEHIYPKSYYPEKTFKWQNYVLACYRCNSTYKKDKFAVLFAKTNGEYDILPLVTEPPAGSKPLFIDPRTEKPMEFIRLDLQTGIFIPDFNLDRTGQLRAEYTIDTLKLNRNDLPRIRRNQFHTYYRSLKKYVNYTSEKEKRAQKADILNDPYPTVWAEMQRQHQIMTVLTPLFKAAPEALKW
jgi:uncharacterized protein (TIGR02646 family)